MSISPAALDGSRWSSREAAVPEPEQEGSKRIAFNCNDKSDNSYTQNEQVTLQSGRRSYYSHRTSQEQEIYVTLEYEGSLGFMFKKSSLRTCMSELSVKLEAWQYKRKIDRRNDIKIYSVLLCSRGITVQYAEKRSEKLQMCMIK